MRKLFVYFLWTLLFVTVIAVAGAFYAIDKGWIGYMPPSKTSRTRLADSPHRYILLMVKS